MKNKIDNLICQFKDAFAKFQDVMQQNKNEYIRDSAIQRFEFTFELMWKTLKAYLEEKGVRVYSPKDAIKGAFQVGLIEDDSKWLAMIETRNLTSHVYNETMAERVYASLKDYIPLLKKLIKDIVE
jgi:nucleotidyltransferase substrate binding protein (TIGR01987 family)